jgi:hypothetical protein
MTVTDPRSVDKFSRPLHIHVWWEYRILMFLCVEYTPYAYAETKFRPYVFPDFKSVFVAFSLERRQK